MQSFFVCIPLDTKIQGLLFLILAEMDTVYQLAPLLTFPIVPSTFSLTLKTRSPAGSDPSLANGQRVGLASSAC